MAETPPRRLPRKAWIALIVAAAAIGVFATLALRAPSVPYAEARAIVDRHCVACHSENPTIPAFPLAAAELKLDTAAQMQQFAEFIRVRVTVERDMPLLNKTHMTEEERARLGAWASGGAEGP